MLRSGIHLCSCSCSRNVSISYKMRIMRISRILLKLYIQALSTTILYSTTCAVYYMPRILFIYLILSFVCCDSSRFRSCHLFSLFLNILSIANMSPILIHTPFIYSNYAAAFKIHQTTILINSDF